MTGEIEETCDVFILLGLLCLSGFSDSAHSSFLLFLCSFLSAPLVCFDFLSLLSLGSLDCGSCTISARSFPLFVLCVFCDFFLVVVFGIFFLIFSFPIFRFRFSVDRGNLISRSFVSRLCGVVQSIFFLESLRSPRASIFLLVKFFFLSLRFSSSLPLVR
jgi:hypothetical protein